MDTWGVTTLRTAKNNRTASATTKAALQYVDLSRGEDKALSTNEMWDLYKQIGIDAMQNGATDEWSAYRELGTVLGFGGYAKGNTQIQSVMDKADILSTTTGYKSNEQKMNMVDSLLSFAEKNKDRYKFTNEAGEQEPIVLTTDLIMQINPTDMVINDKGEVTDIKEEAIELAAAHQAQLDSAATTEALVVNRDVLTKKKLNADDYQTILDSGLFGYEGENGWVDGVLGGKEALDTWGRKSQATRELLVDEQYQQAVGKEVINLTREKNAAKTQLDIKTEEANRAIEEYDASHGGEGAYEAAYTKRAEQQTIVANGKEKADILKRMESTDESTRDAALDEWVAKGYGSKTDFNNKDNKFDIELVKAERQKVEDTVSEAEGKVAKLDEQLTEIDEKQLAVTDARTKYDTASANLTAKQNEQEINTTDRLIKKNNLLNETIGKKGKLTADQLAQLQVYDHELYEKYQDSTLSAEDYDAAVRTKLIASLEEEKAAYQAAGDSASAYATQQEIDALKQEQNTEAINKATEAYNKYTKAVNDSKTQLTSMKSGVDILTKNVNSDTPLTNAQITTLSQSGLNIDVNAYNNAANASERGAIAANAWSQYLIKQQEVLEQEQGLYSKINETATNKSLNWDEKSLKKQVKDVNKFIIDEFGHLGPEAQGQAKAMFDQMAKDGIDITKLTYGQAYQYLIDYSQKSITESSNAFDIIKAQGLDSMKSLWQAVADEEKAAANKAVEDWEKAFAKISKTRQATLKGEDISSQIGSFEDYTMLLERSGLDEAEFNRRLTTGESISFTLPSLAEHQALLQKTTGLTDENYNFNDNVLLQKWQMNSNITSRIMRERPELESEDEIIDAVRTEALSQISAILKSKYGDTKTDKEIEAMAADYWDNWSEDKWKELGTIATTVDSRTGSYAQYSFRQEQKAESEILKSNELEEKTNAYKLLKEAFSDTTVRDKWWDIKGLSETDLKDIADAFGITVEELKDLGWEDIRKKFINLGVEIDNTDSKFSKFQAALAAGEFDNKSLSQYTTLEGERIWTDENNPLTVLTEQGFNELIDANNKQAELGGTVVQGPDGKYYVVSGGQLESTITEPYKSSVAKETVYQDEASEIVSTNTKEAVAAYRSKVDADLSAVDKVQIALEKGETIDWEALATQLDLTNPKILEAYNNFRNTAIAAQEAGQSGKEALETVHESTDQLTTSILQQGDATFENDAETQAWLEHLKDANQVTTELGEALTFDDFMAIRAGKSINKLSLGIKKLGTYTKKALGKKGTGDLKKDLDLLRQAAKKAKKPFDDYIETLKDLSKEEKEAIKEANKFYDSLDQLKNVDKNSKFDEKLSKIIEDAEDMNHAMDGVLQTLADYSPTDLVEKPRDIFDQLKNTMMTCSDDAKKQICDKLGIDANDIVAYCEFVGEQLEKCNGNWSEINWGEMDAHLAANLGDPLTLLNELLSWAYQIGEIDWLELPPGLVSALTSAIAAGQAIEKRGGGGAHNGTPSSSGGKGGGGGGKAKNYEGHKNFTDETERYHEINQQLEKQQRLLTKIDKQKSMTFGKAHLKAMEDEIEALEQENILNEEKLKETRANLSSEATQLRRWGATMNPDGTLNYNELMSQAIAEYNAAVDQYNTSGQTAQDDLALERAKKHYEELMTLIENYEEDLQQQDDLEAEMLENQIKRSGLELEKIQYEIEVKFDLNDRDIKELQYFRTKWEETLKKQGDSFNGMIVEAYKYEDNLATLGAAIAALDARYNAGKITQADYAAGLQDLNDKMLEQLENLTTIKKTIKEAYGNTLELASDQLSNFTSILDHSREVMADYISMQQLMNRGQNFSELTKFYQIQYDSSLAAAGAAKQYNDQLQSSKKFIEDQIAAAGGWETAGDVLRQQWTDVNNALIENENDLLDKTQQALEDAQAMFENTMQAAIESFDKIMLSAKSTLKDLEDDYAYYQEESSRYLSTAKELYEVSKLNREINDSLAKSTTKASKERLKALQEEINAKAESNQLTEYDVNMMELQYRYALALEDLEDKRNAKSIVRLTRDDAGNYGYQYTANEEDVSGAAQQVDDVLQQINELAAGRVAEIEQAALEAERTYRDTLLEISQDTTLTIEQRTEKMKELTRQHQEAMLYYQEQYGNSTSALLTNQQYVYERYGTSISENSHKMQDQMSMDIKTMIDNTRDYAAELTRQMSDGGEINEAMKKYKKDLNLVQDTTGLSWAAMTSNTEEYASANEQAKKAIQEVKTELDTALKSIESATKNWQAHALVLDSIISKYETLNSSITSSIGALSTSEASETALSGEKVGKWQFSWSYKGLEGIASNFDTEQAAYDAAVVDMTGKFKELVTKQDSDADTATIENTVKQWISEAKNGKKIKVREYLGGGLADYTGPAWVDGTKTKPELVLNSSDTQNMLDIVNTLHSLDSQLVRNLVDSLHMSAVAMLANFGSLSSGSLMLQKDKLEQDVHIEANFPNVTEKDEIVDAFNDLINMASQYANR